MIHENTSQVDNETIHPDPAVNFDVQLLLIAYQQSQNLSNMLMRLQTNLVNGLLFSRIYTCVPQEVEEPMESWGLTISYIAYFVCRCFLHDFDKTL
jgi:hypothetical protein